MKFGVVIVTYNRLNLLKECIEACLNQTYKFTSIIIVNNCSTDGTFEYLEGLKEENIKVINCDKNLGGAGGFYEGIKYATEINNCDYLLIIDDDAIINIDYNEKIHKVMEDTVAKGEKILAYSGTVITNNEIVTSTRKNINKDYDFEKCDLELYKGEYFDYDSSSFCGLYVSMDIIKKIGLPKKEFFIWYDDTEYCMRIRKYTIIRNVNAAILNHKAAIQTSNGMTWKSYYGIRNRLYIEKKYFSKKVYIKHVVRNIFKSFIIRIKYFIKRDIKYKNMSKIFFWATVDFIRNKYGFNEKFTYLTIK